MNLEDEIIDFVSPYYKLKDQMHDLTHINRVLMGAKKLGRKYEYSIEKLTYASYFHGIIKTKLPEIQDFLGKTNLSLEKIEEILQIARDSDKSANPLAIEGQLLHDAHLIEGGKNFLIVKSLITGTILNQKLQETINFVENEYLGKYSCIIPEAIEQFHKIESYTQQFIDDLRKNGIIN